MWGEVFVNGLNMWAIQTMMANMHIERLLALIKQATLCRKSPEAERVVSCGWLTQALRAHRAAGAPDCRSISRQQLQREGAPIEHEKTARRGLPDWGRT